MRRIPDRAESLRLRDLFPKAHLLGDDAIVTGCTSDLARVEPGDLFAAVLDSDGDGHLLASAAVERGASAVVCEHLLPVDVPQVIVDDSREAFGIACHQLAGQPSRELPVIGVAGTHGKTTASLLLASVLNTNRQGVAAITSLAHCDSVEATEAHVTTPKADELVRLLTSASEQGASHAVLELTSDALAQRRAAGAQLAAAVITNIRRGPSAWHGSQANYQAAIERVLGLLTKEAPVAINSDDRNCQALLERIENPVLTFGLHTYADVTATVLERAPWDQTFLLEAGSESVPVCSKLIGVHNIYNCLSAATIGLLFGLDLATIARGLEAVEMIPARMERIECGQPYSVYVDSAASPDALSMCLKAARQIATGRVISVLPMNGHDPSDLPLLGRVLERTAHKTVLTGARKKDDQALANAHEVLDGFNSPGAAHVIPSRDEAIRWALDEAAQGDVVVVCGGDRSWRLGRKAVNDAAVIKQHLYDKAARENAKKPLVFAYSG